MSHCLCDTREQHPSSECVAPWKTPTEVQQDDVRAILAALHLGDHARPYSPHAVIHREILPAIRNLACLGCQWDGIYDHTCARPEEADRG